MDKTLLALAGLLLAASTTAIAQETGKAAWEEYDKLVDASKNISMLGSDALGDSVDLATGGLSFSATDISIPGNSKLPVSLTRSFTVTNRDDLDERDDLLFADWNLDLPRISGTFASTWPDNRCTGNGIPPGQQVGNAYFQAMEYWDGVKAKMPGGGDLLLAESSAPKPTDGNTYRWVTSGWTYFRCLGSIQNGTGQGFLAIASDGTKYWFDWMAQHYEPPMRKKDPQPPHVNRLLVRRVNMLYATKIEDRFGNTVTLTFTNAWNAPARLTKIASSDGRQITFTYNSRGHIATASDGTQTWTYGYSYPSSYRGTLTTVTQPDGRQWSIGFGQLSNAGINYNESRDPGDFVRSCFIPGDVLDPKTATGNITHPSGATGSFTVTVKRHGRSNVPAACAEYTTPQNDPNDDVAVYPINWDAFSLTSKTLSGPGLTEQTWSYSYSSTISWEPAGGSIPVCPTGADCSQPFCVSDDCAGISMTTIAAPGGKWSRYIFGNSYRYNEGKLLRVEEGVSASNLLRVTDQYYVLAQSGQPFPTPIGRGVHPRGDSFVSEYLRPLRQKDVYQDGAVFSYRVDTVNGVHAFDEFAQPTRVTRFSTATGGGSTNPTLGIPTLTVPASDNNGAFTASWTSVSGAASYRLEQRKDGGAWGQLYSGTGISKAVSGLANGTYDYRAQACNADGCGSYSATASTVVLHPPGSPTVTAPTSDDDGVFTVTWTSVGTATEYRLEQRKDGGAWSQIYSGAGTSKVVSGLSSGSYDYRARACNTGGCSGYSALKTTVVTISPNAAPTLTAPTTVGTNVEFTVSWTSIPGATSYELQMGGATVYNGPLTYQTRSHRFDGAYSYRVRACNAGGCGPFSATKTVQVVGGGGGCGENPCPAPQNPEPPPPEEQPEEGGGP